MNLPTLFGDLSRDPAAIQAELDRLEKRDAELQAAFDDAEHDTRRCNDALERAGWRSGEAESRSAILLESLRAIVDDRERNRVLHGRLKKRLDVIRKHLYENEHND